MIQPAGTPKGIAEQRLTCHENERREPCGRAQRGDAAPQRFTSRNITGDRPAWST